MAAKKKAKQVDKKKVVEITATFYVDADDVPELGNLIVELEDICRSNNFGGRKGAIEITGLFDKK